MCFFFIAPLKVCGLLFDVMIIINLNTMKYFYTVNPFHTGLRYNDNTRYNDNLNGRNP